MRIFLYRFTIGTTLEYRLTNGPDPVMSDGKLFEPVVVGHSDISRRSFLSNSLTVAVQRDNSLVAAIRDNPTRDQTALEVIELNDGVSAVLWSGKVSSWGFRGTTTFEMSCKSWAQMLRQAGRRRSSSRSCNHSVYSPSCGLGTSYGAPYAPLGVEVSGLPVIPDSWVAVRALTGFPFAPGVSPFDSGILVIGSSRRFVRKCVYVASNVVDCRLDAPWEGLSLGDTGELWGGCDKSEATCLLKFNNLANFGGQPDLPLDNPITGS
jgi:hypothetical protein